MSERLCKIRERAADPDDQPKDLEKPEVPESSGWWMARPGSPAHAVNHDTVEVAEVVVDSSAAVLQPKRALPSEPSTSSRGAETETPHHEPELAESSPLDPIPESGLNRGTLRTLPPVGDSPNEFRGWRISDFELLLSSGVRQDLLGPLVLELEHRKPTKRLGVLLGEARQLLSKRGPNRKAGANEISGPQDTPVEVTPLEEASPESAPGSQACPICEKVPASGLIEWREAGQVARRLCHQCNELLKR